MDPNSSERRKFLRALFPCKIKISSQGHLLISHTENISIGGIRIMTHENLRYIQRVGIELSISKDKKIECEGRIAWVTEKLSPLDGEPVMFDTGIEFVDLSEDNKKQLEAMINKILSDEQKPCD